jgi:hypothetical protein
MKVLAQSFRKTDWLLLPIITVCYFWFTLGAVTLLRLAATTLFLLAILGFGIILKPFVRRRSFPFFAVAPRRSDITPTRLRFLGGDKRGQAHILTVSPFSKCSTVKRDKEVE